MLSNHSWVRLCSDGCYRISVEGYLLITVGFVAKAPCADDGRKRQGDDFMCSSFWEAAYALVNKESYMSYKRTYEALNDAMASCCGVETCGNLPGCGEMW